MPTKKLRDLAPLVLEVPTEDEKLTLEIRRDSKTILDCVNSHATLMTKESTIASAQNLLREWVGRRLDLRHRVADWAIVLVHTKCGPVRGRNSLDAELGGCGMLMENLSQWIDTSPCVQ